MKKVYIVFGAYDYEFPSEFEAFESFEDAETYSIEMNAKSKRENGYLYYNVQELDVKPSKAES